MPVADLAPPSKGEQTRAKLLEAAHGLFLRQGFHGTRMRQIADKAGLAVGGIYNHFQDKEEIFAAVLDAYHPYHTLLPALEASQGETIDDFVRDVFRRVQTEIAGAETRLLPLVFMDLVEFQGRHLRQLAQRIAPQALAFFQRFAEQRGPLRATIPPVVMLRTLISLFLGYLLTALALRDAPILRSEQGEIDWFGHMAEIYLHGIVADQAEA